METQGHPVLSVYLDLDPSRFPTPAARDAQLEAVLDQAGPAAGGEAVDQVRAWLSAEPAITRGAHGLAIFCSSTGETLEAVALPAPVEPIAIFDSIPWLEPLVAMIWPGDWGIAVLSRRAARLFRGGPTGLAEFAAIHHELHGRHAQGGWSQARFQRGIEEQVAEHVRVVAGHLLRAHRRHPFDHLVIVASNELQPVIEQALPRELADLLAAIVDSDLEHAPVEEIDRAVGPVIERVERDREHALTERLDQALGTGGAAAAGFDEVIAMLEQRRVETLVVSEQSHVKAGLCPTCGRLSTADDGSCPLDGARLGEVDATEHAVEKAARQRVPVVVIRHERGWLSEHGEFAAILRW